MGTSAWPTRPPGGIPACRGSAGEFGTSAGTRRSQTEQGDQVRRPDGTYHRRPSPVARNRCGAGPFRPGPEPDARRGAEEANSLIFVELQQIESAAGHYEAHEVTLRQSLAYQTMDETQRQELKVLDADLYRRLQEAVERVAQAETFRERVRGLIDGSAYLEVVAKVLEVADHPEVEQSLFEAALEYHSGIGKAQVQFPDSGIRGLDGKAKGTSRRVRGLGC
ncbi:MAG: hypothetical protein R3C09_20460 [Pirellulaceae bacterium]